MAKSALATWRPSPNFSSGRNSFKYIVLHTTEGTGPGAVAWFQNPASQVSAHYVVIEDGSLVQMVDEDDTAWHAGRIVGTPTTPYYDGVNPNLESIGIECGGYAAQDLSPTSINATVRLIADIRSRHGNLPLVMHAQLSPGDRTDPGLNNFHNIEAAANNGGDDMTGEQILQAIQPWRDGLQKELQDNAYTPAAAALAQLQQINTRLAKIEAALGQGGTAHKHDFTATVTVNGTTK